MDSSYTRIESDFQPEPTVGTTTRGATQDGSTGNGQNIPSSLIDRLKQSSHPIALTFYLIFRVSPIVIYMFGNFFLGMVVEKNRFILHFIILIFLVAGDFWNLKNIAGRLLVGLRWWNETNPVENKPGEFENIWVFETADPNRYINPIDSKMFWILLYAQPVAWIILAFFALLNLQFLYLILVCIAIALSLTNAMAFTKCDKFGKANNLASSVFSKATGSLFSRFNPFS